MPSEAEWVYRDAVAIGKGMTRDGTQKRFHEWARRGLEARAALDFDESEGRDVGEEREWLRRSMATACGSEDADEARVNAAALFFDADVIETIEDDVQWDV